jgi:ribosomal protein S6--L-glutamate ligase
MKKLKFAIIGPETENTFDLIKEIENRGHEAEILFLSHIYFLFEEKELKIFNNGKPIEDFDIIFFRGYNLSFNEAQLLSEYFINKRKTVIDDKIGLSFSPGKLSEAFRFTQVGIDYPQTYHAADIREWKKILDKIEYPVIVKPINGRKGRSIEKIRTKEDALAFLEKNPCGFLLQKYYPIKSDIRILVVGDKVIGAFERFIKEGEFKSNLRGTPGEKIEVFKEIEELSLKAARAVECEIAGVDIFNYEGKNYVLEANLAPQWEKFKKVTGINPAPYIIDYAMNKFDKRKQS